MAKDLQLSEDLPDDFEVGSSPEEQLTVSELTFKLSMELYRKKAMEEGKPWPPPQIPRSQWPVRKFKIGETDDT